MEMEGYPPENDKTEKPNKLVELSRKWIDRAGFDVQVSGEENLKEIPKDKHVIIASSHLSDHDTPIAVAIMGEFYKNLKVVDESTHYHLAQNPIMFGARKIADEDNFLRVDMDGSDSQRRGLFKNESFSQMKKSLEEGSPLVMAAYFDPKYADGKWELPDRPGNGVAYLAQITEGAVIVPVAVDIHGESFGMGKADIGKLIGKPNVRGFTGEQKKVTVNVGEPIVPENISGIEIIADVMEKREKGEKVTDEEKKHFKQAKRGLKEQSALIMHALANLLPEEKRGSWGSHEDLNTDIPEQ